MAKELVVVAFAVDEDGDELCCEECFGEGVVECSEGDHRQCEHCGGRPNAATVATLQSVDAAVAKLVREWNIRCSDRVVFGLACADDLSRRIAFDCVFDAFVALEALQSMPEATVGYLFPSTMAA